MTAKKKKKKAQQGRMEKIALEKKGRHRKNKTQGRLSFFLLKKGRP